MFNLAASLQVLLRDSASHHVDVAVNREDNGAEGKLLPFSSGTSRTKDPHVKDGQTDWPYVVEGREHQRRCSPLVGGFLREFISSLGNCITRLLAVEEIQEWKSGVSGVSKINVGPTRMDLLVVGCGVVGPHRKHSNRSGGEVKNAPLATSYLHKLSHCASATGTIWRVSVWEDHC